jgi:predicted component of type VI protein secretion system
VTELYDRVPDPEIVPDEDGRDRLDRLVDFQRLLAPPPQTPAAGHAGEALFERTGCAVCHTPRLVTGDGRRFAPYSDFLLHDLGDQGDGIRTGSAAPSEMRTAPLWGLTGRRFLWHDGALALEPFDVLIEQAVARHAGQAAASRAKFAELSEAERELLTDFLRSLGRAPHDLDADGRVTPADGAALISALESGVASQPHGPWTWRELLDLDGDGRVAAAEWAACARSLAGAPGARRELAEPRR